MHINREFSFMTLPKMMENTLAKYMKTSPIKQAYIDYTEVKEKDYSFVINRLVLIKGT